MDKPLHHRRAWWDSQDAICGMIDYITEWHWQQPPPLLKTDGQGESLLASWLSILADGAAVALHPKHHTLQSLMDSLAQTAPSKARLQPAQPKALMLQWRSLLAFFSSRFSEIIFISTNTCGDKNNTRPWTKEHQHRFLLWQNIMDFKKPSSIAFFEENVCFRFCCLCSAVALGTCLPKSFLNPHQLRQVMNKVSQDQDSAGEGSGRAQPCGPASRKVLRLCLSWSPWGLTPPWDRRWITAPPVSEPSPFPSQVSTVSLVPCSLLLLFFLVMLSVSSLNPWAQNTLLYIPILVIEERRQKNNNRSQNSTA